MNPAPFHINLVSAWIGLLLACISGALMGLKFHEPDWLGGYTSFPRRMIRLGHISFFVLAMVNLMFYLAARSLPPSDSALVAASWLFVVGAITMPVCCALLLRGAEWRNAFVVPVSSLLVAAGITLWKLIPL
jgi:hypothetical protein